MANPYANVSMKEQANQLGAQTDRPQTQMESCLQRLADCTADVHMQASNLLERLGPVLSPTGGAIGKNPSAPVPVRSPLANSIDTQSDRLCDIRDVLREINERLAI